MNHNIRDRINMPLSREDSVSPPIKNWPLGMNLNNTNTISSQVPAATTQEETNGNTPALWMKRLGMMIGGNAGLKDEIHQSPTESTSHPTRRLSIEDVQNVLRNIKAEANNPSPSDPPSILKSKGVYSQAIDSDIYPEEEATNNTVYMLSLLMMLDSYRDNDRVKLGLPASDRAPNSLAFKADSSFGMDAVKGPRVNAKKEQEERGGEGEEACALHPRDSLVREEPNEGHPVQPQADLSALLNEDRQDHPVQPQADLSALLNEDRQDRPVQPQSNLSAALLAYKPRRAHSSIDSKDNSPNTSDPLSDPLHALQTLQVLAQRASHGTATTQATADSDSHLPPTAEKEHTSLDAAMMKYKPKRKNAPPGASAPPLVPDEIFGSFTTMTSTGTFKDAQKRSVPTTLTNRQEVQSIQNTRSNSSSKLRGKASCNDDTTSPLNITLDTADIFPSTGTFKDVAKRHVPRATNANTPGGLQNASNDSWGKFKATKSSNDATSVPLSNTLEKNSIFPSTGTFRDVAKRQVRTVKPEQNQEWDIEPRTAAMPSRSSGNSPMWGFNNPNAGSNKEVRVNSRQDQQQNTDEGNVSEPEKPKNIFQRYMENKAKQLLQQKPSVNFEATIPPKTAEAPKPAAKSELLVDWGDQGTDSEEEEEEENNGIITFVKNDSSRRISDITIQDDFDSDEEDMLDISCKEMRERIRSLSIAEEPEWNQNIDCNEGQNNAYFMDAKGDEGLDAEAEGLSPPVLFRSESERTSSSHETVKTSTRKSDDNIIVDTKIKSVEMGKGLIRNMSAITLHEFSDEELDT